MTSNLTAKRFPKGTRVVTFGAYNHKGLISIRFYEVRSSGDKQIHLIRQDGSNALFRVYPNYTDTSSWTMHRADEFPSDADIEAAAREFGRAYIASERARYERILNHVETVRGPYRDAIQRELDSLLPEPVLTHL